MTANDWDTAIEYSTTELVASVTHAAVEPRSSMVSAYTACVCKKTHSGRKLASVDSVSATAVNDNSATAGNTGPLQLKLPLWHWRAPTDAYSMMINLKAARRRDARWPHSVRARRSWRSIARFVRAWCSGCVLLCVCVCCRVCQLSVCMSRCMCAYVSVQCVSSLFVCAIVCQGVSARV